jgi:hypothetical protein
MWGLLCAKELTWIHGFNEVNKTSIQFSRPEMSPKECWYPNQTIKSQHVSINISISRAQKIRLNFCLLCWNGSFTYERKLRDLERGETEGKRTFKVTTIFVWKPFYSASGQYKLRSDQNSWDENIIHWIGDYSCHVFFYIIYIQTRWLPKQYNWNNHKKNPKQDYSRNFLQYT